MKKHILALVTAAALTGGICANAQADTVTVSGVPLIS